MKPMPLSEFCAIVGGASSGLPREAVFDDFVLDSREAKPGSIFLAVAGENVDGHDYAQQAIERGCVAAVVERLVPGPHILVPSLVDALKRWGLHSRNQFSGPVIGITGSAGKTSTKEFVAAALSVLGPVLKTVGNRNTELTMPLAWSELTPEHKTAAIEMGMRGFGQIAHLASIAKPSIGIITNVGFAHLELVHSREGILKAKTELFDSLVSDRGGPTSIFWHEDDFAAELRERARGRVLTFGDSPDADAWLVEYQPHGWVSSEMRAQVLGINVRARLPVLGRQQALNALAALLAASAAGVHVHDAAEALADTTLPPLRMEFLEIAGVSVLLDTYNASPPSMQAAIDSLVESTTPGRRVAVLGEMRELGTYTAEAHKGLGRMAARAGLDLVGFIGDSAQIALEAYEAEGGANGVLLDGPQETLELLASLEPGDAVLVKGSRLLELEQIVERWRLEVQS